MHRIVRDHQRPGAAHVLRRIGALLTSSSGRGFCTNPLAAMFARIVFPATSPHELTMNRKDFGSGGEGGDGDSWGTPPNAVTASKTANKAVTERAIGAKKCPSAMQSACRRRFSSTHGLPASVLNL